MRLDSGPRAWWSLSRVLIIVSATGAAAASEPLNWQSRVTAQVQNIWRSSQNSISGHSQAAGGGSITALRSFSPAIRYDSTGRLQLDVAFDCAQSAPTAALRATGMVIGTTVKAPPMCVAEGWASVASVPALASLPSVKKVDLPKYARRHPRIASRAQATLKGAAIASAANGSPAIDGNGITIMNADKYIEQTKVNGAGVTFGVISDDVASLALIQARGELPASVNVVQPSANPSPHPSSTDEGTMMLEEAYAVAPGANLAFCGPETYTEYLACFQNLTAAGAMVISDDVSFPGYDVMSAPTQNDAAQALQNLLTASPNVMLFTAVGNNAADYWQGAYDPVQIQAGGTCSNGQAAQTDNYFQQFGANDYITWQTNGGNPLMLASVVPAGQTAPNNFDVYVYDPTAAQVVACATSASGGTEGSTSYTFIDGSSIAQGNYYIFIGTTDATLSTAFLKVIGTDDGGGTFSPMTSGAPFSPQDFTSGVISVGAVFGDDAVGDTIESFSNTGPIQLVVPTLSTLQAPLVVAPDAIYVDNSGTDFIASGGIFSGTSAASPNTAAVAVLLRSAFPTLSPAQITTSLETGAAQLSGPIPNGTFGYGRVDAVGALATLAVPTITPFAKQSIVGGKNSGPLAFTLGGTGALTITTNSDNTALVAANSQAINVSPPSCGAAAGSCNLTISPTLGQIGTAHITVAVVDGANRSASTQITVIVTKPAPPSVNVTTGATQTLIEGGKISPVTFSVAGTQTLSVAVTSSNVALVPSAITLTAGCGPTVLTCTATPSVASGQTGSSVVTITATDPYSQSSAATATVTVNAPPSKGGGGALDLWALLGLCGLGLLKGTSSRRP
jgi:hypothetical protein